MKTRKPKEEVDLENLPVWEYSFRKQDLTPWQEPQEMFPRGFEEVKNPKFPAAPWHIVQEEIKGVSEAGVQK